MRLLAIVLGVVLLFVAPLLLPPAGTRIVTEVLYLSLFAISFNFIYSYMGLLSFGHNLGFGAGAYAAALYLHAIPTGSLWIAFALAVLAATAVSFLAGVLLVQLKGGYFALMTMATCQFGYFVVRKWSSLTNGDDGLLISPPQLSVPLFAQGSLSQAVLFYWLVLAVLCFGLAIIGWYLRTPLGRATILLRENEQRAAFLGYNTYAIKLTALSFAGAISGLAGTLFVFHQGLVSPVALEFGLSGDVIMMTLIGGSGTLWGPAIGAAIYTGLEDILPTLTGHPRFVLALLFVFIVIVIPDGMSGLAAKLRDRLQRPRVPESQKGQLT